VTHDKLHPAGEHSPAPWLRLAFISRLATTPPERLLRLGNVEHCLTWVPIEQTVT
jgi:hypothetical protein